MNGDVGVGYRLLNEVHVTKVLLKGDIINDYALIEDKVSEFFYVVLPSCKQVEGFAISR
jgi:hypothetical protein